MLFDVQYLLDVKNKESIRLSKTIIYTYCAPGSLHKLGLRLSASSTVGHMRQTTCVTSWQYVRKARVICCASWVASIKFIHFCTQHAISIAFRIAYLHHTRLIRLHRYCNNCSVKCCRNSFLCISLSRALELRWSIWSSSLRNVFVDRNQETKGGTQFHVEELLEMSGNS